MFEDFLDSTCNIYHTENKTVDPGYGIRPRVVKTSGKTIDLEAVPCHFHIKVGNTVRVVQREPYSEVDGETKLTLPIGTDIRVNDTVEDCKTGLKYRAGVPHEVHGGHHIVVQIYREGGTRAAI